MTAEEFLFENQEKLRLEYTPTTSTWETQETCDPCEAARAKVIEAPGSSSDNLDPRTCIMVDERGQARYMILTEDGRWVPVEEWR